MADFKSPTEVTKSAMDEVSKELIKFNKESITDIKSFHSESQKELKRSMKDVHKKFGSDLSGSMSKFEEGLIDIQKAAQNLNTKTRKESIKKLNDQMKVLAMESKEGIISEDKMKSF